MTASHEAATSRLSACGGAAGVPVPGRRPASVGRFGGRLTTPPEWPTLGDRPAPPILRADADQRCRRGTPAGIAAETVATTNRVCKPILDPVHDGRGPATLTATLTLTLTPTPFCGGLRLSFVDTMAARWRPPAKGKPRIPNADCVGTCDAGSGVVHPCLSIGLGGFEPPTS